MQNRYRIYRRGRGSFYVKDRVTGKAESLATADRSQAQHLLAAKNQAVIQPQLNRAMARTYLMAKSPELVTRTWAEVMEHYVQNGVESTRDRIFASSNGRGTLNASSTTKCFGKRAEVSRTLPTWIGPAVLPLEYYEERQAKKIFEFGKGQRRLEAQKRETDRLTGFGGPCFHVRLTQISSRARTRSGAVLLIVDRLVRPGCVARREIIASAK